VPDAVVSIQCTSPLVARKSYWCIISTMEASGFEVRPYQVSVPSFGVWGFALATTNREFAQPVSLASMSEQLRFLDDTVLANMFQLPRDVRRVETEINQLNNQILVRYYDEEWGGRG